jgi:hypothetical protein
MWPTRKQAFLNAFLLRTTSGLIAGFGSLSSPSDDDAMFISSPYARLGQAKAQFVMLFLVIFLAALLPYLDAELSVVAPHEGNLSDALCVALH